MKEELKIDPVNKLGYLKELPVPKVKLLFDTLPFASEAPGQ